MAYSKLGFVKSTPLAAKVRKYPGDPTPEIWSAAAGDMSSWRFSNTRYTLNGVMYGETGTVPGGPGGGTITAPLIISTQDYATPADTGYEQTSKVNFSGGSGGMYDLRINDAAAVIAGAVLMIGEDPGVPLYTITGGNTYYGIDYGVPGDDLSSLKTKLINILNSANAPGEPLNGKLSIISPSGDDLPNWVQIHLEQNIGQNLFLQQGSSGYDTVATFPGETHFNPGSDPFIDLRIDNAQNVIDGGSLIIGTDPADQELLRITGGNTYYGIDYGVPGDDLSTLKTKLVNIINAATAPGEPLDGYGIFASPSGDNLPSWVQIHVSGDSTNLFMKSERVLYSLGVLPSMEEINVNFSGARNIYVALVRATMVVPGALDIVNKRMVLVMEVPADISGYATEIDALYDKIYNLYVQGAPGFTPTIHEVAALVLAFTPPTGTTGDRYVGYFRDNFTSELGWMNSFIGTGFGIDVFNGQKSSHSNNTYTLDGGVAGATAEYVYGTDQTIPERAWEVEFDYDVSNTIPVYDTTGGPPNCPLALYSPVVLEGVGTGPMGSGASISAMVVKGTNGTFLTAFDYSGGAPLPFSPSVNDTGRIKIVHDGSQGYEWLVSYDNGDSWTSLGTSSTVLPMGYEGVNKKFVFGCLCFATGNTPDARMDNVIFRFFNTGVNLYDDRKDVSDNFNYILDMVGFTDGIHDFTGIDFGTSTQITPGGSFAFFEGGSMTTMFGLSNFNGHDTVIPNFPIYWNPFDGSEDLTALAVTISAIPLYICVIVPSSQVADITNDMLTHGADSVDVIKVDIFTSNGIGADYSWNFTPPIPPTPSVQPRNLSGDVNGIDEELRSDVYDIQY